MIDEALSTENCSPELSIIVPLLDEQDNIPELHRQILSVCSSEQLSYELIYVDDGSTDNSASILDDLAESDNRVRILHFRRNFGQTAAMMAGMDAAEGEILITLDADLQNDPSDIPLLLEKLGEGYDLVSGWRKNREDAKFRRVLISKIANRVISKLSGVHLHDYGCTLKAYRREIIQDVKLYGEMHRFIPIYASWAGAKITEIPVKHHARSAGVSHYGLERIIKVLLDLFVVIFLHRYASKPIYIFGGFGVVNILGAMGVFGWMLYLKYAMQTSFIQTPLPMIAVLFFLMGVMSILLGLIAEMLIRTYFESQNKRSYLIRKRVG